MVGQAKTWWGLQYEYCKWEFRLCVEPFSRDVLVLFQHLGLVLVVEIPANGRGILSRA